MPRFIYRLQKVFELRERKKKEQEQRVVDAQKEVRKVEAAIEAKINERQTVREFMLASAVSMLATNDNYIHHLNQKIDGLREDLRQAEAVLETEKKLLQQAHADLEALIKHRDKMKEEWAEEEKRLELKQLDEIASQRYFRQKLEEAQDAAAEEQQE